LLFKGYFQILQKIYIQPEQKVPKVFVFTHSANDGVIPKIYFYVITTIKKQVKT